jgi:hypothetical protein
MADKEKIQDSILTDEVEIDAEEISNCTKSPQC